jgi:hypothetical protein
MLDSSLPSFGLYVYVVVSNGLFPEFHMTDFLKLAFSEISADMA